MKKRKLFLLPLFCLLLTGCGSQTSDQGGEGDGGKGKEEREKIVAKVQDAQSNDDDPGYAAEDFAEALHDQIRSPAKVSGYSSPHQPEAEAEGGGAHTQKKRGPQPGKSPLEKVESGGVRPQQKAGHLFVAHFLIVPAAAADAG